MQKDAHAKGRAARMRRAGLAGVLVISTLGFTGCAPRLIQDYAVREPGAQRCVSERQGKFVFAVQEGTAYQLGECDRKPTGELTNCQMSEVEFE